MSKKITFEILDYINLNINDNLSIDNIANHFYFNKYYLMRLFKKEFDITIVEYINSKRILNSLNLLFDSDEKILKVALMNGFNSAEYYTEQFTKIVGLNPITTRKIYKSSSVCLKEEFKDEYSTKILKFNEGINKLVEVGKMGGINNE